MRQGIRSGLVPLGVVLLAVGCTEPKQDASLRPYAPALQASPWTDRDSGGSAKGDFGSPQGLPIEAVLTDPPNVPPPTGRDYPAKVIVKLEVKELEREIAPGVRYTFWTFGGTVPGKFIRVRQGDTVEFQLMNAPDSKMPHNIDLHAVTGPGGGAAASFTAPGQRTQFTFKALNQGLYVYHCATAPVGLHVANGMYGLIYVEPPAGLPRVDREFYVMQGDFYTLGQTGAKGLQPFDQAKAVAEQPTYVVFNGKEGALMGDGALRAEVGQTVRLFIGNGGPNLASSFHVIGEIFDYVHSEGGSRVQENVQTTLVPPGGSAIVDFKLEVPGSYTLVDHAIFRAFHKGAIGQLQVSGPDRAEVFSGTQKKEEWLGAATEHAPKAAIGSPAPTTSAPAPTPAGAAPAPGASAPAKKLTRQEQIAAGGNIYVANCQGCHQLNGAGLAGMFPPLAKSDFLMADKHRSIAVVVKGLSGPITVNGRTFNSQMPPLPHLSDAEVANVLTYVRNSFGNSGDAIRPEEVAKVRGGNSGSLIGQR